MDQLEVERPQALSDHEFNRLVKAASSTSKHPIFVSGSILTTPITLLANARRLKAKHDIKLLIVDYIQLMDSNKSEEVREREVAALSRWLKVIAKELDLVVICLSQITDPGGQGSRHSQSKRIKSDWL